MELAPLIQARRLNGPSDLQEVLESVEQGARSARDYPDVALRETRMRPDGSWMFKCEVGKLSRHAFGQLCNRLPLPNGGTVPAGYLSRCPASLTADHLNHWLTQSLTNGQKVLIRTKQETGSRVPRVRAVLSERYARVDHLPVLQSLAKLLPDHHLSLSAWSLDDEQLTLRLLLDHDHPASLDDPIRVGLHISNSEVGLGRISVTGLITRLVCANGLVIRIADLGGIHRRHVGRVGEDLQKLTRDSLPTVLQEAEEAGRRFIRMRKMPPPVPSEEFVKRTAKELELSDESVPQVLSALEGETFYDAINAFTRVAQRFPVAERVRIETLMSRFLQDGANWN